MRFLATVDIDLPDDIVERSPTLWDRCQELVGTEVDLSTHVARCRVEAVTFLYQFRAALDALGIDNARWLAVDGELVFEDHKGRPNDLPELMTAFADHVLLETDGIRQLRLCVEHLEAGLGLELEARMAAEHPREEPAARVSVTGRILDLAPRSHESADDYRRRLEGFAGDAAHWAAVKIQFSSFVSRLEQELGAALPGASLRTTTRQVGLDLAGDVSLWPTPSERHPPDASRATLGGQGTAAPPRNFTIPLEKRIAAAISGPPPFAVRLRKIEDLRGRLLRQLALAERDSLDTVPAAVERGLAELNRLIDEHNRYYPIERNLGMDPATGELLALDQPWRPLAKVSIDLLRHQTAAIRMGRVR